MGKWNIATMNEFCNINANGYKVLDSKYIDKGYQNQLFALIKCPNPNHESYWVWWNNFRNGNRCKQCYCEQENIKYWNKHDAYDYCLKNGYQMLNIDDFKDVDKSFYCYDKNKFIVSVSISNLKRLLNGKHSVKFSIIKNNKYAKYNIDLFCKLYRPEYEFISDKYLGVKELHWFKYNGQFLKGDCHNRKFQCTIDCFINGNVSHPYISKSNGEIAVENILIKNKINYISQYTFSNCKDKQKLPFDFYLPDYNICIEYQGRQHYESVDYFGGETTFIRQQKHDNIKNKYCEDNNVELLRIPYWEFNNIQDIITNKLIYNKNKEVS